VRTSSARQTAQPKPAQPKPAQPKPAQPKAAQPTNTHVEERSVRRGDIDLRLVINRSHGHARFMDYRVGNYEAKRELLDAVARELGLHKIFTLVEKGDSQSWRGIGFTREGIFPGLFRTADAYAMARLYDASGAAMPGGPAHRQAPIPEGVSPQTRRLRRPEGLTLRPVADATARGQLLERLDGALGPLPFARLRAPDLALQTLMRQRSGWVCAELDTSFGHATLGIAPLPDSAAELAIASFAGQTLIDELAAAEIGNVFGLAPTQDSWATALFSGLGFRTTGQLVDQLRGGDNAYVNATVWHRRLVAKVKHPE